MENEALLTGFDCVANKDAEILILGSMPGVKSLQQQQYYAHPRNAFWKIIEQVFGIPHKDSYSKRLEQLKSQKLALWDVVHQCERSGSLDSAIRNDSIEVNDFKGLFQYAPNIRRVCLNGGKAADLFRKHVIKPGGIVPEQVEILCLPSTSPANAAMSFEQKLHQWRQICA